MVCFQPVAFLCLCSNTIGVSLSKPDLNITAKMKQKLSELPAEEPAPLKMSLERHQTAVHPSLEHRRCRRRERQLINGTQLWLRWFIKVDNLQTLVSLLLTISCQRCVSQHVFHTLISLWDPRVTFHVILYRRPKQRACQLFNVTSSQAVLCHFSLCPWSRTPTCRYYSAFEKRYRYYSHFKKNKPEIGQQFPVI